MTELAKPKLLLVEDRLSIARCYTEFLSTEGCTINHVSNGKQAIEFLKADNYTVVLLDLQLPDIDGYLVLEHIRDHKLDCEVVVITAHGSYEVSKRVINMGASDYLEKPFSADRLRITVRNAISRYSLSKDINRYRGGFSNFIGSSIVMQGVYRIIENAATSRAAVFITGESGTGKEVCAEALHQHSDRRDKPCVTLNCAAIPRDLMESEIFGHVKGAFTGAVATHEGAASQADGGTLFLDEIGEMDLALQSKFLRFIQTGQFKKVGSNKIETVDVRFVSATNRDPLQQIEAGTFRGDLYYRLNVIPIHMPPLRERGDDIIEIAQHFLIQYAEQEGKQFNRFSDRTRELLLKYPWPGNVRELLNILHNSVVLNDGEVITPEMLPINKKSVRSDLLPPDKQRGDEDAPAGHHSPESTTIDKPHVPQSISDIRPLWQVEMETIEAAIELCQGNVTQAAKLLEISPSTIYRKKPNWKRAAQFGQSLSN